MLVFFMIFVVVYFWPAKTKTKKVVEKECSANIPKMYNIFWCSGADVHIHTIVMYATDDVDLVCFQIKLCTY